MFSFGRSCALSTISECFSQRAGMFSQHTTRRRRRECNANETQTTHTAGVVTMVKYMCHRAPVHLMFGNFEFCVLYVGRGERVDDKWSRNNNFRPLLHCFYSIFCFLSHRLDVGVVVWLSLSIKCILFVPNFPFPTPLAFRLYTFFFFFSLSLCFDDVLSDTLAYPRYR